MLTLKAKFLKTALLPGKEEFPPSRLASLLDTDTGEVLNLIGPAEPHAQLGGVEQFDDVAIQLRWRRIDLRTLGGSGRGKALAARFGVEPEDPCEWHPRHELH